MKVPSFQEAMNPNDQITDVVLERKATPDVLVKYYIINAWALCSRYEAMMRYNRIQLYKNLKWGLDDEANYTASVCLVFNLIKFMIMEKLGEFKKRNVKKFRDDSRLYLKAESLEYNRAKFNVEEVMDVKNFVFEYLHILSVTNLLRDADRIAIEENKWADPNEEVEDGVSGSE